MVVLVNANNKGGVGKTTTSHNLARFLSKKYDLKILAIDMDQQMNFTDILKEKDSIFIKSISEIFRQNPRPEEIIYKTRYENVFLIPASVELSIIENEIAIKQQDSQILKQWLSLNEGILNEKYGIDIVIIDCAPDVGNVEKNAFEAADTIIIVINPSDQAIRGLKPFAPKLANQNNNNDVVLLYNEYDESSDVCIEITQYLLSEKFPFKKYLLKDFIPKHTVIEKSNYDKCISVADYQENEFENEKYNPYTQYNNVILELKTRGVI